MSQEKYIGMNIADKASASRIPGQVNHGKYSGDECTSILVGTGLHGHFMVTFKGWRPPGT